jgi:putative Mg2+ transporter-C (MgtC) family protein
VTYDPAYANLLLAMVLGAVIGWERFLDHKPAGLRTHTLVSLGAAGVMIAARGMMGDDPAAHRELSRVVQGVITGIGFLGAGSILQSGVNVRGLTTAASIWVVAAIGIAAGGGQVGYAVALTVATWIVLRGFRGIERAWRKRHPRLHPQARMTEPFDRGSS